MENNLHRIKGRGAQILTANPYTKLTKVDDEYSIPDIVEGKDVPTQFYSETSKTIINKVTSPDLGLDYSMNPYQGCEHGCVYCYARNTHEYWGFSAGLDFERKIIVKHNAEALLLKALRNPKWIVKPIMLSGNTDCYQPIERKMQITRKLLLVLQKYNHPVSVITKNALILRDAGIIQDLASQRLVHVSVSLTTLDENLRQKLEPRTVTSMQRLKVIETLSKLGIPVNVMVAPVIPSLNSHEIPEIIQQAANSGALSANYTIVRLNGSIKTIFENWLESTYPDKAKKVLNQIAQMHGGKVSDSRFGVRMQGDGKMAEIIKALFLNAKNKYMPGSMPGYNLEAFVREKSSQYTLF